MKLPKVYNFKNLLNQRFGRLLVLEFLGTNIHQNSTWKCICDCGTEKIVTSGNLISGDTKSCGCLFKELASKRQKIHGVSINKSLTYIAWVAMRSRCYKVNNPCYKNYGGRGITVCERWMEKKMGYVHFLEDMGEKPSKQHSLDRINNDLGYSKENCRWATRKEQNRNTRRNILLEFDGQTKCLKDWAKFFKISRKTLKQRLNSGLSIKQAILKPYKIIYE